MLRPHKYRSKPLLKLKTRGDPLGESENGVLRPDFDRSLKLEFHGSRIKVGVNEAKWEISALICRRKSNWR
jgi:hypothetical protein